MKLELRGSPLEEFISLYKRCFAPQMPSWPCQAWHHTGEDLLISVFRNQLAYPLKVGVGTMHMQIHCWF